MAIVEGISRQVDVNEFGGTTWNINVLAPNFRIVIQSTRNGDFVTDVKKVGFLRYKKFHSFVTKEGDIAKIISEAYTRIWEYVNLNPGKFNPWSQMQMLNAAADMIDEFERFYKEPH
ncbi:MAG: hypothetical protein RIG77_00775 [Cyclobacteriaceae bacterium]